MRGVAKTTLKKLEKKTIFSIHTTSTTLRFLLYFRHLYECGSVISSLYAPVYIIHIIMTCYLLLQLVRGSMYP